MTSTDWPGCTTDRSTLVEDLLHRAVVDSRSRLGRRDGDDLRDVPRPDRRPEHWTPDLVAGVTHARRAVHQFDDLRCDLDQLLAVAGEARRADADLWGSEVAAGRPAELVALAWRVDGLPVGAYSVTPALDLAPVPAVPGARSITPREFVIQDEFAAAPVMLLAGGNLAAALAVHGVHGHRLLASRASTALHTSWLTAVALGGYGCLFGGVVDAAVRAWAGADGSRRSLVLGAALGFPSQQPQRVEPE
jgi:hypothetical protein